MEKLALHPRDTVPPFSHAIMKRAQELAEVELRELQLRQKELQELLWREDDWKDCNALETFRSKDGESISSASTATPAATPAQKGASVKTEKRSSKSGVVPGGKPGGAAAGGGERVEDKKLSEVRQLRAQAKAKRGAAEKALKKKLEEVKADPLFQEQVTEEAGRATSSFTQAAEGRGSLLAKQDVSNADSGKNAAPDSLVTACKRMVGTLTSKMRRRRSGRTSSSIPSTRTVTGRDTPRRGSEVGGGGR